MQYVTFYGIALILLATNVSNLEPNLENENLLSLNLICIFPYTLVALTLINYLLLTLIASVKITKSSSESKNWLIDLKLLVAAETNAAG